MTSIFRVEKQSLDSVMLARFFWHFAVENSRNTANIQEALKYLKLRYMTFP